MKIVTHIESDRNPVFIEGEELVENWFDNRGEPIVRCGGEAFQAHLEPEIGLGWDVFTVDPRRSFVVPLWHAFESCEMDISSFAIADFLVCFLQDVGIDLDARELSAVAAFHTMIPSIVSECLANSWVHIASFNRKHRELARVVNNPFFYAAPHASSKRLLEIAQDDGCTYAVDMSVEIPPAETLAHEIALLNHIQDGDDAVAVAERDLLRQVQEVL